jgi:hypothetical protein
MEDWGTQSSGFIGRALWEEFFGLGYRKLCDAAHSHGMIVILHSCGMLWDLIESFIEAGIDVLQFDQTSNYRDSSGLEGIERLGSKFGGRVTFFCPVDIQQTLVTGDRSKIEDEVRRMIHYFASREGGFIAKSYGRGNPVYLDAIGCEPEWNNFAFDCFVKYGQELFQNEFALPELEPVSPPEAFSPVSPE